MSYAFPPRTAGGSAKSYAYDITVATRSNKNDAATGFCRDLKDRVTVVDFDSVKDDFCSIRKSNLPGAKIKSVDAFFKASDSTFYFLEFKKSTSDKLDAIDEDGDKIPFSVSLKRKAVDSLAVSALTVLQDVPGRSISDQAVLFVVFRPSATDSLSVLDFNACLTELAGGADSVRGRHPVMWGLEELKEKGFYRDVHTWPENEFVAWANENLK